MTQIELTTLKLSFQIALFSVFLILPISLGICCWMMRLPRTLQSVLDVVFSLPLAVPPVVTGYLLLIALGRNSAVGRTFEQLFGIRLSFTFLGAVIAASVVAFPLAFRTLRSSLMSLDQQWIEAARTLGLSPFRTFIWIVLPLIWPSLVGAAILSFVRALGEFGATMVFAGSIEGETRTLSIQIWNLLQDPSGSSSMMRLLVISIVFCGLSLFATEVFLQRMQQTHFLWRNESLNKNH